MPNTDPIWTITSHGRTVGALTIKLARGTRNMKDLGSTGVIPDGMTATVDVSTNSKHVSAKFEHERDCYARAEAARCYAMILDTIGDFEETGETALACDDPDLEERTVSIDGEQAAVALIGTFGDDFANLVV